MTPDLWIAVISGFWALAGTVATAYFKYKEVKANKTVSHQEKELKIRHQALALPIDLKDWSTIQFNVDKLLDNTSVDRFLVLRAFNGKLDPQWTTAIYQLKRGHMGEIPKIESYVHFGLDDHYRELLVKIHNEEYTEFFTEDLPEKALIRSVYENEEVATSRWYKVKSVEYDDSVAVVYVSFSKFIKEEFTASERNQCAVIVNEIKSALDKTLWK